MKTIIETALEQEVMDWLEDQGHDYDDGEQGAYDDLQQGGCQSGIVSKMTYYCDTIKFYENHQREIDTMLADFCDDCGCDPAGLFGDKWDSDDPFACFGINKNLLAWFGFEETARRIMEQ